MAQTYNKLIIEVKEDISDIITAKQDDTNSRFLDVYLRDDGTPINLTGHEVKIYGRKPDGTSFFNNGEITEATKGRCQFELTNQALSAAGRLEIEISIWENNRKILTTQTFNVFVAAKIRDDSALESSNEFNALVVLFQKLYDFWADISDTIGQTNNTGGTTTKGTVMAKLNAILGMGGGGIKSVQRGQVSMYNSSVASLVRDQTITINAVNMNKSFVLGGRVATATTNQGDYESAIKLTSSTSIIISGGNNKGYFFWQVVEFY